jgi:hypothetical protein
MEHRGFQFRGDFGFVPMTPLDAEFERCSGWLQDALDYAGNSHELSDVKAGILEGRFTFWPAPDGAIVTEFIEYPAFKVIHAWLVGGRLEQIVDMIPSLVVFGRSFGCTKLTGTGRPGWVRALKEHGFNGIMTTVSKEITP